MSFTTRNWSTDAAGPPGSVDAAALEDLETRLSDYTDLRETRKRTYNVLDYGADPTGVADSSAAFAAVRDLLEASLRVDETNSAIKAVTAEAYVPAGSYLITSGSAMMSVQGSNNNKQGPLWRGAGKRATTILFKPTVDDQYLFSTEYYQRTQIEKMAFFGFTTGGGTPNFYKGNTSTANPSALTLRDVDFKGTWRYGIHLTGTDNNSDYLLDRIGVYGTWTTFFYASSSDQFVNYTVVASDFWPDAGVMFDFTFGGNIQFYGGGWIGAANNAITFLKMGDHSASAGATRCLVSGIRIEVRHPLTKLIDCAWPSGHVTWDNCDHAHTAQPNLVHSIYRASTASAHRHPIVSYRDCKLTGKFEFEYGSNSYLVRNLAVYSRCVFSTYSQAADAFVFTAIGGTTNHGGKTSVVIEDCRGGSDPTLYYQYPFDCVINGSKKASAPIRRHIARFGRTNGGLAVTGGFNVTLFLPPNVRVRKVSLWLPPQAWSGVTSTNTSWGYTVQSNEGTPTVLLNAPSGGAAANVGFSAYADNIQYIADTALKQQLILTANANVSQIGLGFCEVEYEGG